MAEVTAEKFAQRTLDLGLVDSRQLNAVWSELGSRDIGLEAMTTTMVRKELLTNFQVERILRGERIGYFYGNYKVLYLIGTGTFARVYRAVHRETGDVFAVKVLRKRYRDNAVEFDQFLREARVGQQLRHPNVVPVYEVDGDPRAPFMVMEFVEGQNLRELVSIRKQLDLNISLRLLEDVMSGLAHAAEKGITHRDLKLSNVLVTSGGRGKLVDFGLAAASDLDDENALADCPNARAIDYAALERGTGVRKDDVRSDIYFSGCMLYHMISGQAPLSESRDRIQRLNFTRFRGVKPIGTIVRDLPPAVISIVNRAMELDPAKRYANPLEMLGDLKTVRQRLKEGRLGESSKLGNAERALAQAAAARAAVEQLEGQNRRIMVVESKIEMQNFFRDRLKKRGYRVLILSQPQRAMQRFEDDPNFAECAIFCTTELGMAAVEAFNEFGRDKLTKDTPAVLFLERNDPQMLEAAELNDHRILLPPGSKFGKLRETLLKLLETVEN